jgi:HlyD family secretion protein
MGGGIVVLLALAAVLLLRSNADRETARYTTEAARHGELVVKVSATGHLEPTNQVEVGSELSGIVDAVLVDFNDRVRAGEVLARLDTDTLQATVLQSEATLAATHARVRQVEATVEETRLKLERCARLAEARLCPAEELDTSRAAHRRAQADLASAQAQVAEARARLEADRTRLSKAVIVSPIDGVVLDRAVEPGQTVAASLQAPVLFRLAEDLAKMELHVDVDEADVGEVREGQVARFSVDAFPNRSFDARIVQVRFGAREVDGVISYETVLRVDNADLSLRPGMTATAEIVVQQIDNALLVPNAALRFNPTPQGALRAERSGSLLGQLMPRPPPTRNNRPPGAQGEGQRVWLLRGGEPAAVPVKVGASDGIWTQVIAGELEPGSPLVVGMANPGR